MPRASIGFYLSALVAAVSLPILVLVVLLLSQLEQNDRRALERRVIRDAQSMAGAIDRQLGNMSVTLHLLANSPELATGDLALFQERTEAALRAGSYYLLLVRADGQQLLNTRVPFGSELGRSSNMPALEAALASRRTEVSDVFFGATGGRWVFNMTQPLTEELTSAGAALILTQNVSDLTGMIEPEAMPAGWSAALVDRSGRLIVSSNGTPSGSPFAETLLARVTETSGIIENGFADPDVIAGYARVAGWSWTAFVWGPTETAQASIVTAWQGLVFGGLALLATAFVAVIVVGRQLRNSIVGIAGMAHRLGKGEIVSPVHTRITEVEMVARALSEASFDRSEAEDRNRFILRELAHRTKNLLSVVQAMIRQTARRSETTEQLQATVSERLRGLAQSIDLLTAGNWSGVPLSQVIRGHLSTFLESEGRLDIDGPDFRLTPEAVQHLGMALHELATNAVKYGALSVPHGNIRIDWTVDRREDGAEIVTMRWREFNGPAARPPKRKGFGTMVIKAQVEAAFRANVETEYKTEGFAWTMTAPLDLMLWKEKKAEPQGV